MHSFLLVLQLLDILPFFCSFRFGIHSSRDGVLQQPSRMCSGHTDGTVHVHMYFHGSVVLASLDSIISSSSLSPLNCSTQLNSIKSPDSCAVLTVSPSKLSISTPGVTPSPPAAPLPIPGSLIAERHPLYAASSHAGIPSKPVYRPRTGPLLARHDQPRGWP